MDPLETLANSFDRAELQAEYDGLQAQIQKLGMRAGKIQRLISLLDDVDATDADSHPANREADEGESVADQVAAAQIRPSLSDAVLLVMRDSSPDTIWTSQKILIQLQRRGWEPGGKTPRNSVDATLSRLRKMELVERTMAGVYKLPSETSNGTVAAVATAASLLDGIEEG